MTQPPILVEYPKDGVVKINLNRAKAMNAISVNLLQEVVEALQAHQHSGVIVLVGAGDRLFCAGEDLKQTLAPKTGSAQELREAFHGLQEITRLTSSSRAIVIVAVHRFAIGGGAEIALAADFVIGGPGARFRFPEVTLGHAVTGGISLRLVQLVGLLKPKELLLTGRWVDANEALRLGMVNEVSDDPKQRAMELAFELAKLPAIAMSSPKTSLERVTFTNREACLQDEVNVASYCFAQSDAAKAFSDFAARIGPSASNSRAPVVANGDAAVNISSLRKNADHPPIGDINTAFAYALTAFPKRTFFYFAGQDTTFEQLDSTSVTLRHVVKAADPKLAIVDSETMAEFTAIGVLPSGSIYVKGEADDPALQPFSHLLSANHSLRTPVKVTPATTAAFLFTSGTTGKSKPCVLSHEYFILQAQALIDGCGLCRDDVLYSPFPMFHADATALTIIPALLLGALRAANATVYDFMGATLALTYKQPASPRDRDHSVRLAWGVPVPSFAKQYEARFGHPLVTLYGSVEASLPIFQDGVLPPGSCGRVRQGYQLRIADDGDEEVPPETVGHLLLRADAPNAFFQGFFEDVGSTAAAFKGLWLHAGNLAKVDADGNVYFMGRVKHVIRRRGENVNAAEVEEELMQHPDVVLAVAYRIQSQLGEGTEQDVKVAVQVRSGSKVDEEALWLWAVRNMARFQVPSVIEFVAEVRRTPTGKMEKSGLTVEGGRRFDMRQGRS
ncbi:acetyl-CoA synthetase-like protein [Lophium mytilinum]|uniref:Acetyl-CoA synthetase-like protein n=1 Tax=Lophium mytilinum TaxID=390894 RepID=A0A6A6QTX5_9PEZI|nr:acetyl-CoA synthetase-like protein [Lophium mytilinum]